MMSDLELAIINAAKENFPENHINTCFYHLLQTLYRKIQKLGLQVAFNDPESTEVNDFVLLTGVLALVPVGEVRRISRRLKASAPANMSDFIKYFEETYVGGKPTSGGKRAVASRYLPEMWNQYMSILIDHSRTNNVSKGWYNKFRLVVGSDHLDIYSIIKDFRKEQNRNCNEYRYK